uniref:Cocaine- and amphetamine-regulated transcript protein n=1 Tax=Dromaius novaehollandiae TaxID=8790 RepID=A0A8C4PE79_DRONO
MLPFQADPNHPVKTSYAGFVNEAFHIPPPPPPSREPKTAAAGQGGEDGCIEALQEVLEKLKSKRIPHYEKKFGQVPMCDAGEQCAVRKGARIGKLCDCPRATSCNSFLLKCL